MFEQPPIEEITRRIVEAFDPERIVLFGSRARGEAQPDSDVDLMVEMESDLPRRQRAIEVDRLFARRHWPMDIVVYTPAEVRQMLQQRNSLASTAEREGRILYERGR
jgi:predicted nucleotidyltransferase